MRKKLKLLTLILLSLFALPGVSQEDDKLLEDLEADRKKQTEMARALDQGRQNLEGSASNAFEELQKLTKGEISAASLMDKKVVKVLQKVFRENHMQNVPREEVRNMILKKSEGTLAHRYLSTSPKLVYAFVDVLRDKEAMPGLIGIFLRQKDLKLYFFIWLGIMIGGWAIKRFIWSEDSRKSLFKRIGFSLLLTTISLTIFYQMFYQELSPTVNILISHWKAA